jgi:ASC-1-like (ASCH) protein|tara:strand:+ start:2028 stop:2318 length:291 start_codon:yes stop_codon:yes gene_type:complete
MTNEELRLELISAGRKAVAQLIKVAKKDIIKDISMDDDLAADKMKNAAAAKKLAIFDAFEILSRIEQEKMAIEESKGEGSRVDNKQGFAERRSGKK